MTSSMPYLTSLPIDYPAADCCVNLCLGEQQSPEPRCTELLIAHISKVIPSSLNLLHGLLILSNTLRMTAVTLLSACSYRNFLVSNV